jgi:hypothetical protein
MALLWLGALLSLLPAGIAAAQSAAGTVDAADYLQLLLDTAGALRAEPVDEATLTALASRWDAIEEVAWPAGQVVPVDTGYVARQLRDPARDGPALAAELEARAGLLGGGEPAGVPAGQSDALLDDILSRPEFQYDTPPQELSLFQRLERRLLDLLGRFLNWLDGVLGGSGSGQTAANLLQFILVFLAVTALVVILLQLVSRALGGMWVQESALPPERPDEPLTADGALSQARTLSGGGDFRSAVRYLYLSLLLSLEERGFVRYDRSLTNREYLRSVADRPEVARVLADVIDVFDRVWYGYQPIDESVYRRYERQVEALRRRRREGTE